MRDRETFFLALWDAVQWQESLADACRNANDGSRTEALAQAARYRALLKRRYGSDKSAMEVELENSTSVSLAELRKRNHLNGGNDE